jgi:gas vesicle protein
MRDDRWETSDVVVTFLLGALAGAATAILVAPRSGEETRYLLRRRARDTAKRGRKMRDRLMDRSRNVLEGAGAYVEKGRDIIGSAGEYLRQR